MSSRAKTWSLAALAMLFLAGLIAYVIYHQPRTYANYALYSDTGLVKNDQFPGMWGYGEKPGHQTLVIARGEDHTHVYTDTWFHEKLSIEFDAPLTVGRIDLAAGRAKLGYFLGAWMSQCTGIEKQGVRGWIDIESVEAAGGVVASYDITVTTSGLSVRDVRFQGRSTFGVQPRPDGVGICAMGSLFPQ